MTLQITGNNMNDSPELSLSGGISTAFSWSPFGGGAMRTGNEASLPGFNGERPDPLSGVTHLGNGYRAYSPALRRFTCPDSESPFGGGGVNPYVYCDHDPINNTDPSGHMPKGRAAGRAAKRLAQQAEMDRETARSMPSSLARTPEISGEASTSSGIRKASGVPTDTLRRRRSPTDSSGSSFWGSVAESFDTVFSYFAGETVDFETEEISEGVVLYKNKKKANTEATIIAHGGYREKPGAFTVPDGLNLHFLARHGDVLIGPKHMMLRSLVSDTLPVEIVKGGGRSYDYILDHFTVPGLTSEIASTYRGVRGDLIMIKPGYTSSLSTVIDAINLKHPEYNKIVVQSCRHNRTGSVYSYSRYRTPMSFAGAVRAQIHMILN